MPHALGSLILLAVLITLLAGCVGPDGAGESEIDDEPVPHPGFRYRCPPGDTLTLSNGLCITTFADPRETFEEPYVAVHPQRPQVMAIGMNAWHAEPRPVLRAGVPSLEVGRVALFVTQDGGATWTQATSPPILYGSNDVGKTSYSGDPVIEFDPDGVLHYLQTSVTFDQPYGEGFPYIDIQYARSEDLGASWSQNRLLADDGDNDRPWLTIGPEGHLYATWRNNIGHHLPPELAWSQDGGTTWATFSAPSECTHGDRAIVTETAVLMPCTLHDDGDLTKLQINRFDKQTQRFEAVGQVPAPATWDPGADGFAQWDMLPNATVLALATRSTNPGGFLTFSRDSGATWSDPVAFNDLCECPTDTGSLHLYGAKFDPWGGFHLMLTDGMVQTPDSADESNLRYALGEQAVYHVTVDVDGNALHEQSVRTSVEEDPRTPPSAALPIGRDDYYIPAFWETGGAIAWTRDKGIDLTHVVFDRPSAR